MVTLSAFVEAVSINRAYIIHEIVVELINSLRFVDCFCYLIDHSRCHNCCTAGVPISDHERRAINFIVLFCGTLLGHNSDCVSSLPGDVRNNAFEVRICSGKT